MIDQQRVDQAADDLLAKGIRPTIRLVQRVVGGDRPELVGCLEDWARRLHCRITGHTGEALPEGTDKATLDKASLVLMREAETIQKRALRTDRAPSSRPGPEANTDVDQAPNRRQELRGEIERWEHKLRGARERAEAITAALRVTERDVAKSELRLKGLVAELQALSPPPTN